MTSWSAKAKLGEWNERLTKSYGDPNTIIRDLEDALDESSDPAELSYLLDGLGHYWALSGGIAILNSDQRGWDFVFQGWKCMALRLIVNSTMARNESLKSGASGKRLYSVWIYELSVSYPAAIIFNRRKYADWAGELLTEYFSSKDRFKEVSWDKRPLEPFLVQLNAKARGDDAMIKASAFWKSLGQFKGVRAGYQAIIDNWESDRLAEALKRACECFIHESEESSPIAPYDALPAELMAVYKIRQGLNLETPVIDHTVLNSLLAAGPNSVRIDAKHPLFERGKRRIQELLPEADLDLLG